LIYSVKTKKGGVSGELILPSGQEVRSFEWEKREKSWVGLFRVDKVNPLRDKISNGVKNFQ
jgi:hypothetical protein